MSTDLGLDPSDPLNLLLHNSQNTDSNMEESGVSQNDGASPPDWAQLSSLWDGTDSGVGSLKPYPDLMDFSELNTLPMDMDFNPAMALEPGSLNSFNPSIHFSYEEAQAFQNVSAEMIPPQFSFTFQAALNASDSSFSSSAPSLSPPESPNKERRLSVASSSSSSGVSLSPVLESLASPSSSTSYASSDAPSPPSVKAEPKGSPASKPLDPAAEIAEAVRQSAGVMLAVPMSADLSSQVLAQSIAMAAQNKPSLPRMPRSTPRSPISSSSSAASTPPPATPPMSQALPNKLTIDAKPISTASSSSSSSSLSTPTNAMPPLASATSTTGTRPKTSHTTIERRYRTNLNARIQSLRMAVPALRVLEDRDGGNGKKIKKNLKDGVYLKGAGIGIDTEDGTTVDVIDERGFVDGVKVARKCSKANVLGKAVEYIRVLKKREMRLKAEQNGLKALVCGLVGGPALLKEWEQRWREQFGGEEKDEVEGEDAEEEDSDDEEGDEDDEVGRKRKRAKTSAPAKKPAERKPAPPAVAPVLPAELGVPGGPAVPEKRKRGRPRKVQPPPIPVATLAPHMPHQQAAALHQQQFQQQQHQLQLQQQHQQQQQAQPDQVMLPPNVQPQGQAPQYMLAVFALFSFFNSPITSQYTSQGSSQHSGMVLTPPLALAPEIVSQLVPPAPAESSSRFLQMGWAWKDYFQVLHLAVSVLVLGTFLWSWLGLTLRKKREESKKPEAVNWTQVCNEAVLKGETGSLSTISLAGMYHALSSKTATISQLTSLSLAIHTSGGPLSLLSRFKAHSLWNTAKTQSTLLHTKRSLTPPAKTVEKLVFESFTLEEAVKTLEDASERDKTNGETPLEPIGVLGAVLVKQRVKQHLGVLFVEAVSLLQDEVVVVAEKEDGRDQEEEGKKFEVEVRRTVEAAKELGGWIEQLGRTLERVWKSSSLVDVEDLPFSSPSPSSSPTEDESSENGIEGEIQSLLTALVLYRKLFSGTTTPTVSSLLISPPPSPTGRVAKDGSVGGGGGALLSLRKALGSRVFEDGDKEGSMEDARDKVVDLIVDTERRGRSVTPLA
ncbi:hypothetical protein CC1G_05514 [Coprinopsis cinerea okayama7|uniref:BHLH domain-containing protein n=1 Tax=Coprinopsis cinerea (strain Okayama-7 / 130 / ATCC MYA-4618 / FGSC 9003) TaxID=240176 RepID=A8P5K0_COPC7|nr:hypothetical protein CC1G_05514 [Coprinopsis cinerea okayama7\|eukprot:XP_001838961.1 hypothetical protein CC1G_05514 [Coprinopsis cinerea okayama7\